MVRNLVVRLLSLKNLNLVEHVLNKGCIPTKTYLKNAEILDGLKIAAGRGINLASTNYTIDMDKTVDFKNSVVKTLTEWCSRALKATKVTIFNGLGQVNPDKTVTIGSKTIKGRNIILATGSKVSRINIPGIESHHDDYQMISLTCVNCLNHLQLWVVVSLVSSLVLFMPHTV